jgi:hypothetical protein
MAGLLVAGMEMPQYETTEKVKTCPTRGRWVGMTPYRKGPRVGRNEPCPCNSGKKYKNCHQKQHLASSSYTTEPQSEEPVREAT